MRVIIVEGPLDEVLAIMEKIRLSTDAVLEKIRQNNGTEDVAPVAHNGNRSRKTEQDRKGCSLISLLSNRERSIIAHLIDGHSNKVIARDLTIAEATVKAHVRSMFKKLGVRNRTQAAMWGRANSGESWLLPLRVAESETALADELERTPAANTPLNAQLPRHALIAPELPTA